jgi:hypothetical protein
MSTSHVKVSGSISLMSATFISNVTSSGGSVERGSEAGAFSVDGKFVSDGQRGMLLDRTYAPHPQQPSDPIVAGAEENAVQKRAPHGHSWWEGAIIALDELHYFDLLSQRG